MAHSLAALIAAALPLCLIWAAVADLVMRSIPNGISLMMCAAFAMFAAAAALPLAAFSAHLLCAAIVLACGFALFCLDVLGGGDAKLFAAVALWLGFDRISPFLAGAALFGGGLSLFYLARNMVCDALGMSQYREKTIPYGAAIAAGALAVLPEWLAGL